MSYKETKTLDNRINLPEIENNCKAFWQETNVYRYDNTKSREETKLFGLAYTCEKSFGASAWCTCN